MATTCNSSCDSRPCTHRRRENIAHGSRSGIPCLQRTPRAAVKIKQLWKQTNSVCETLDDIRGGRPAGVGRAHGTASSPTAPRPEANGNRLCRALQPSARPDPKRRTTLGVDEDVSKWDPHALLAERCGHWGEQPGRPRATARPGDSTRLNTRSRGHRGTWRSHSPGRTPKTQTCAPTETCTQTCTAAVFTIAPNWGRPDVHQPRMEKPHPREGAVSRHRKGEPRHVPLRDRTLKTPCWGERQTRRPDVG